MINGITGTCGLRWVNLHLQTRSMALSHQAISRFNKAPFGWRAISDHHSQGLQMLALNLLVCGHKCLMCKPRQRHKGRKLGGFGHSARLVVGKEPLEVRKRSPQILINLLVCALVYLWSHSHVLCCRLNPSKLIFERRAWKHLPGYQGCVRKRPPCPCWEHQKLQNIFVNVSSAQSWISLRTRLWRF